MKRSDFASRVAALPPHKRRLLAKALERRNSVQKAPSTAVRSDAYLPDDAAESNRQLLQTLRRATYPQGRQLLVSYLQQRLMAVLRLDAAQRPTAQDALSELGMDSLMSVELKTLIQSELGVSLELDALLGDHNLGQLAASVHEQIKLQAIAGTAPDNEDAQGLGITTDDTEEFTL